MPKHRSMHISWQWKKKMPRMKISKKNFKIEGTVSYTKQELKNEGLEQKSLTDTDSQRMKNNGSLDICYNVQSVVDAQNHFVIDISTTNDINDQNQLYAMAKDATDLLEVENPVILADTGYYNGTEIKNCIDAPILRLVHLSVSLRRFFISASLK